MQLILESKDLQIEIDQKVLEKESLKRKSTTEGLLSATFNLDSHNQSLEDATAEIGKLTRWYEKATHEKKVLQEDLRAQIQGLTQASLDQEEKIKYLTTGLQDSQEVKNKECLRGWRHKDSWFRKLKNTSKYA